MTEAQWGKDIKITSEEISAALEWAGSQEAAQFTKSLDLNILNSLIVKPYRPPSKSQRLRTWIAHLLIRAANRIDHLNSYGELD